MAVVRCRSHGSKEQERWAAPPDRILILSRFEMDGYIFKREFRGHEAVLHGVGDIMPLTLSLIHI